MAYVIASTGNDLGVRPLGYYQRNSFPLPTTSMSLPIQPRLGWDGAPYAVYGQPEMSRTRGLNGEWVPPGPPPRAMDQRNGAATYRIDPRTGKYRFYSTDILPRGVFQQNTFQHPAPAAMSALGVPVRASGQQLVQLPSGAQIVSSSCPPKHPCKSGGSCKCKGHCKRSRRGMGDVTSDTHVDPNTGCIVDSDGVLLTCPNASGTQAPTQTFPITPTDPGLLQQLIAAGTAISTATNPPRVIVAQPSTGLFSGSTNIGGMQISNGMLALGVGALGLALMNHGKRR